MSNEIREYPVANIDKTLVITRDEHNNHYQVSTVEDNQPLQEIQFQSGIGSEGLNGVTIESLLAICADRLEAFNQDEWSCIENTQAILRIKEALFWLNHRSAQRALRGVEGTHEV